MAQRWTNLDRPESSEGWAFPSPSGRSHYFRDGRSLCGRHEIAPGTRIAGFPDEGEGDDCRSCTRLAAPDAVPSGEATDGTTPTKEA